MQNLILLSLYNGQDIVSLILHVTLYKKQRWSCWQNDKTSQSIRTLCSTGIFFKSEIRNNVISFIMFTFLNYKLFVFVFVIHVRPLVQAKAREIDLYLIFGSTILNFMIFKEDISFLQTFDFFSNFVHTLTFFWLDHIFNSFK